VSDPAAELLTQVRRVGVLRPLRAAFATLTRIPVGGFPFTPEEWLWSTAFFPAVGLIVGGVLGLLFIALWPLGEMASASLVIGASLLITGAFHEDGLADTSDALGSVTDRSKILMILKDSRVGSFGSAAITISILTRVALLTTLGRDSLWALPLVGCAARVAPIWLLARMPYVTEESSAKNSHLASAGITQAAVATAWFVVAAVVTGASAPRLLVLAVALATVALICAQYFRLRLNGVTGDLLGAVEQLSEIAGLAVLAWPA
jgi:adenosylcobinamide-GDP ribazoletransferase